MIAKPIEMRIFPIVTAYILSRNSQESTQGRRETEGVYKPCSQRHLSEEGADDERQDEEERHPVAPVFTGM